MCRLTTDDWTAAIHRHSQSKIVNWKMANPSIVYPSPVALPPSVSFAAAPRTCLLKVALRHDNVASSGSA